MKGLTPREKAYEEVTGQVANYLKLVGSSLRVSSAGISITKAAISVLETPTRNPVQLMAGLRSHAEECRLEAQNMEKEFRKVRTQIWTISQKVGINYKTSGKDESHTVDIEKLRGVGDVDLFDVFTEVINQLTGTIARFVAWWDDATINWKNVKEHMITFKHGSGTDFLIEEWRDLQLQYQLYREEVSLIIRAKKQMTHCTADYGATGLLYFEVLKLKPRTHFANVVHQMTTLLSDIIFHEPPYDDEHAD
ncbi:hypothetical protein CCMSSC00406_0007990 [Pleurotus cornucopiae]|uniref:Uncharacterized protein n=1 Tax=Pleurotus cornucopiae TaxID=5321 RepID=A0ACB7IL24_PLECO|nr:hypothetical protein CCMSSC00406_0007990 [Pleurotus cornucopiae]